MSRFGKLPVLVSSIRPPPAEVFIHEIAYALEGCEDGDPSGLAQEDAVDYLNTAAGLRFPWYIESRHTWETPEQAEFNTGLIIELFRSGHIVATRGGTKTTKLGETTFIDRVSRGFTLSFKG